MNASIEASATWLFVPGDRPDRFGKAAVSGADIVVIDLEDAVAPARKDFARNATVEALADGTPWAVRVNAATTEDLDADLAALSGARTPPLAILLAKAERPEDIESVGDSSGVGVVALIETARGLADLQALSSARWIRRLAFGVVDFSVDIGADMSGAVIDYARSALVVASRVAELPGPLDGPTLALDDPEIIRRDAAHAKQLGMGGKLCIHPAQIDIVAGVFRPSDEELRQARSIVSSGVEAGATSLGGSMIDRPVVERALRLLRVAGEAE